MSRRPFRNPNAPRVVGEVVDVPMDGFALPLICCKCDATRDLVRRTERLTWTSTGSYILAFALAPFGLLFTVLVLVLKQGSIRVELPICPSCNSRWRNAKIIRVAALLMPIPIGIAVGLLTSNASGILVGMGSFVFSLIALPIIASLYVVRPATVRASHIDARAELVGFSDAARLAIQNATDQSVFMDVGATPPRSTSSTILWVLAIVGVASIPALGIMATLGIYGVRKYVVNAKVQEARTLLRAMADAAGKTFERDGRLCASAEAPVPADERMVSGKRYQSSPSDWDGSTGSGAGFACLGVQMKGPQYFQYDYQTTANGFVVTARGDLNGDGVFSTYWIEGVLDPAGLQVSKTVLESNPTE